MKRFLSVVLTSCMAAAGAPAAGALAGAVSAIGSSNAQLCFQAAKAGNAGAAHMARCDEALGVSEPLGRRDRAATYVNRGVLYLKRNQIERALGDFDAAQRLIPDFADAEANRAVAYMRLKRWTEALAAIDRALQGDPNEKHRVYLNRAAVHEELGDLRAAYADLQQARALAPDDRNVLTELGRYRIERTGG